MPVVACAQIAEVVTVSVGIKPLAYNSLWQLRNDTWSSLEESTTQLALADAQQRSVEQLVETVTGLLDVLGSIERFWAFPGAQIFREVQRLFAAGQYDRLAAVVGRANRALVTESYRGGQAWDLRAEDDAYDRDTRPAKQFGSDRPYFEVLVVEDLTEEQENSLREELRRWRRPDDQFIYEIVVVPSFDEAVMAARLNFRLQACVVRRRFAHRSRHDSPLLAQFAGIDGSDDLMEHTPDDRAQVLARTLAKIRPELDLYLMTEISVEDLAGRLSHHFRRIFHAREGSLELHLSILDGVAARYRSPFFSALRNYSHRPTGVFHALPISHGKSIVNSHWIRDMVDFYGLEIFLAETSATCGGLDSLLEPTGPLREAQQLAAETFGSRQTYFVTNGTSTANKIVVQALVQPGDIVLVDRNCHQSHHYGLMLAGAMVTYLEAYPLNEYSMYGAVPLTGDQAPAAGAAAGRQAGPGQDAAADQLHVRRDRLRRRPGDGGVPGHQARPGLPVGRGLVRLRQVPPGLPAAHRHAGRPHARRAAAPARVPSAIRRPGRPKSARSMPRTTRCC